MTMHVEKPKRLRSPSDKVKRRKFTAAEYWKMFEAGYFDGQRVELILGEIIQMSAQAEPHAISISKTRRVIETAFGKGFWVRVQATLKLSSSSTPDPDISVVAGQEDDFAERDNPTSALLIAEVANTSIAFDRGRKLQVYAAAKIADYWIVNLKTRKLEVYRKPKADKSSRTGWSYGSITMLTEKESIAPLSKPRASVKVSDLLPRKSQS